jgi:hypothetical protein
MEVWRFKQHVPKAGIEFILLELNLVLSGDIEFLHTYVGLQSCNAMFPCYRYNITKATGLRATNQEQALLRTNDQMARQIETVMTGEHCLDSMVM